MIFATFTQFHLSIKKQAARAVFFGAVLLLSACNFPSARPTELPTDEPTLTIAPTLSPTIVPTLTAPPPTFTALPPTATPPPAATATPVFTPTATAPLTAILPPSAVPFVTPSFVGDRLREVDVPKQVRDGVGRMWVSFVAANNTLPTGTPGTPQAQSDSESVYLVSPDATQRYKVIDLPASTDRRIFWSPNGAYLAWLVVEGDAAGLYMLDVVNGISQRLFAMRDFTPRGFPIQPIWAPDGKRLYLALPTAYDFDIFSMRPDGANLQNLTQSASYELWPTVSPDSAYLAFVSDRGRCPSWQPGAPDTCSKPDATTPTGGQLYVLDLASAQTRLLSDQFLASAPRWITANRIGFMSSDAADLTASNAIWWADLRGGEAQRITPPSTGALTASAANDAWTLDGDKLIYQEFDTVTRLIIRDDKGTELARSADLNFPRFLFAGAWAPDGQRVVLGGRNGQCPFGMMIADLNFKIVMNGQGGPGVCDPVWSPDGRYIAYIGAARGANAARDGRLDIYSAEASGYGARLLTSRISGQIKLLGWIRGGG